MLAQWIGKNQEGSWPCINILEDGMSILEHMRLEVEHLRESKIGKVVKKLSEECSSPDVKRKAARLVTRWYRLIYGLDSRLDETGGSDEQY
jgi:hypothetical protein